MDEKVSAIVLRAVDYLEDDKMLWLYSVERGKFSAVIKGVKKANAKLKFASEPFCFGEYMLSNTRGRSVVTNCTEIDSFYSLREDIDRFYAACSMIETVAVLEEENLSNPRLFLALVKALETLEHGLNPKLILLKFLLDYLTNAGYNLAFDECNVCHSKNFTRLYLDLQLGGVVCLACRTANSIAISPTAQAVLRQVSNMPADRLSVIKSRSDYIREALGVVYQYIAHSFHTIRSIAQLLEL